MTIIFLVSGRFQKVQQFRDYLANNCLENYAAHPLVFFYIPIFYFFFYYVTVDRQKLQNLLQRP